MVDTLKDCPFCGSDNIDSSIGLKGGHTQAHYIECFNCASSSAMFIDKKKAIKAWNTRTSDTQIESPTAQLKAALAANGVNRLAVEKLEGKLLIAQHDIRFYKELFKNETKQIISLSAATSSLVGYLSALDGVEDNDDFNWTDYKKRLEDYYIKELQAAVKVFVDKLGE